MSNRQSLAVVRRPRDLAPAPAAAPAAPPAPASVPVPPKPRPRSTPHASRFAAEPVRKEINVYSACKMPLSMFEAIQEVAVARHITNSEVIRYFVAQGLLSPFALEAGQAEVTE